MVKVSLGFLVLFSFSFMMSCQTTIDLSDEVEVKPCEDAQYQALKKRKFSELTGEQQQYFKQKDKECKEYLKESKKEATTNLFIILASIGAVFLLGLLLLSNMKWH